MYSTPYRTDTRTTRPGLDQSLIRTSVESGSVAPPPRVRDRQHPVMDSRPASIELAVKSRSGDLDPFKPSSSGQCFYPSFRPRILIPHPSSLESGQA